MNKEKKIVVFALFLPLVAISIVALLLSQSLRLSVSEESYASFKAGKVADYSVYAPTSYNYIDRQASALRRERLLRDLVPLFNESPRHTDLIREKFGYIRDAMQKPSSSVLDSLAYTYPLLISEEFIDLFLSSEKPGVLFQKANEVLQDLLARGVLEIPDLPGFRHAVNSYELKSRSGKSTIVSNSGILEKDNLNDFLVSHDAFKTLAGYEVLILSDFLNRLVQPNYIADTQETDSRVERLLQDYTPVLKNIVEGDLIIEKGFIVDQHILDKLSPITVSMPSFSISSAFGTIIFLLTVYGLAIILMGSKIQFNKKRRPYTITLHVMFLVYIFWVSVVSIVFGESSFSIQSLFYPAALFSLLVTALFNAEKAIQFVILLALVSLPASGYNIMNFVFSFSSSLVAISLIKDSFKRLDILKSGFFLMIFNAVIASTIGLIDKADIWHIIQLAGLGALNGMVVIMLNMVILPLLEHILNAPTRFRLLELADINAPILKRLLSTAPGTYNHSMSVSNLAETAAREIGSDYLLVRVGSYYHDIGKIDQPEYFIENQKGSNKHDELKPSLSAAIIKSHVKFGIEYAKKAGLPERVIDIIGQHHGNSVIEYFYQRALEQEGEDDSSISIDDFSHVGIPPQCKEAAVVMLADSVEAATRTLEKPTVSKIEKMVWNIIMRKYESKQLNQSNLTFSDLEIIKNSFVQVLSGYFHSRIEYPGQGSN